MSTSDDGAAGRISDVGIAGILTSEVGIAGRVSDVGIAGILISDVGISGISNPEDTIGMFSSSDEVDVGAVA
jgi:hypothetical protein